MIPASVSIVLAAGVAAGIVASNTPAGAGNLTIVSGKYTADAPRRILITYGNEASNRTVKITGTDRYGNSLVETVTVPLGAPGSIYTANDFATVTVVTVAGAWTTNMTVGTNNVGSTPWIVPSLLITPQQIAVAGVNVSGTATWSVEYTYNDPNNLPSTLTTPTVFALTALSAQSATKDGTFAQPVAAYRLTVTSGQGTVRLDSLQAGRNQ